jgi:hypothetical protein
VTARRNVNRVYENRLWDNTGREWTCAGGLWATEEEVTLLVARASRVVVHGFGKPLVWLDGKGARALWAAIRAEHFEVPGASSARPDVDGLTYAARVWRSGSESLLGLQSFC